MATIVAVVAFLTLYPIYYLLQASFDVGLPDTRPPTALGLANYARLLDYPAIIWNTLLVTFAATGAIFGAVNWVPKWYRAGREWSAEEVAQWLLAVVTRSIAAEPHRIDIDGPRANRRGAAKTSHSRRKTARRSAGK